MADVLGRFPEVEGVFLKFGFRAVTNPIMRNTLGRRTTIGQACGWMGVDLESFLAALNAAKKRPQPETDCTHDRQGQSLRILQLPILRQ